MEKSQFDSISGTIVFLKHYDLTINIMDDILQSTRFPIDVLPLLAIENEMRSGINSRPLTGRVCEGVIEEVNMFQEYVDGLVACHP